MVRGGTAADHGRARRRVHPGGARDQLRLDARDLGDAFERVLRDAPVEVVEADGPVADEPLVVELLADDDVEPAEAHRGVGAGSQLEVEVGQLGLIRDARIEHDHLGAVRPGGVDRVVDRRPRMAARVVPEQHDALRVREVAHRHPPEREAVDRGGVARAHRDTADPVGRAEQVHEPPAHAVLDRGVPVRRRHRECFGAVLVDHACEAFGDLAHRLFVGDLLPLVRAAWPDALQRVADPVRMVVDLRRRGSLEADVLRQDRVLVREDPVDLAVADLGPQLAPDVADRADGVLGGGGGVGGRGGHRRRAVFVARAARASSRAASSRNRASTASSCGSACRVVDIARPSASPNIASRAVR